MSLAKANCGFTHSVILGSMLPIHKRFPSWAALSEMMEAFSTLSAADDMCPLWEARQRRRNKAYKRKDKDQSHFGVIDIVFNSVAVTL